MTRSFYPQFQIKALDSLESLESLEVIDGDGLSPLATNSRDSADAKPPCDEFVLADNSAVFLVQKVNQLVY
jgi:hypothetical protein